MRSRLISRNILFAGLLAYFGSFSSPFSHPAVASQNPTEQTRSERSQQPFSLTLVTPTQPLKAGQRLLLNVNVTNTSDSALVIPFSKGVFAVGVIYQVHVSDQDGRPVPPRPPAKGPGGRGTVIRAGSMPSRTLNPGKSFTDQVNVTDDYDLSQPGEYTVSVVEPYGSAPDRVLVASNAVTVAVIK